MGIYSYMSSVINWHGRRYCLKIDSSIVIIRVVRSFIIVILKSVSLLLIQFYLKDGLHK